MRRQQPEEHVDAEKWAIPYADLLTLLLAFFVVMYSLSSINEAKFRVLAESLNQAFNGTGKVIQPTKAATPAREVPLPAKARAANATPIALIRVPVVPRHLPMPGHEGAASAPSPGNDTDMASVESDATAKPGAGSDANVASFRTIEGDKDLASLKTIGDDVAKALKPWVDTHQVVIRKTRQWLEIEIRTDVLFSSGVAQLAGPARSVLEGVAGVLAPFHNPIRIEGYTDNRPISTRKFPSNWELSAARAGSVARLFGEHGVDPDRIAIFGWGETHPVASNATPDGRNRNRRIAIVVLSDHGMPARYYSNDGSSSAMAATTPAAPGGAPAAAGASAPTAASTPVSPHMIAGQNPAGKATAAANVAAPAPAVALHEPQ